MLKVVHNYNIEFDFLPIKAIRLPQTFPVRSVMLPIMVWSDTNVRILV
jgi:hypothetical protein